MGPRIFLAIAGHVVKLLWSAVGSILFSVDPSRNEADVVRPRIWGQIRRDTTTYPCRGSLE